MIRMSLMELQILRTGIVNRIPVLVKGFVKVQGAPWEDWRIGAAMHRCRELFKYFDDNPRSSVMTTKQEQESFELLVNLKHKLLGMTVISEQEKKMTSPCTIEVEDVAADLFELRSALIAINTPLIFSVTNKWKEKFIGDHDMEDRCSLCSQILIKCVDLFNPYYAIKFSTFAVNSLKREVFRDQQRCNNRKSRFRLKEDIEPSIQYRAHSMVGEHNNAIEVSRIISKMDNGVGIMKDSSDEEVFRRLITHLREGGTVKTFEKDPGLPAGRVKEVLLRVKNQYRAS